MSYPILPHVLCMAIAGLVVTGTAHAQEIYKWKDQNGTTHYGELPPPLEFSSFEVLEVQLQEPVSANANTGGDYRSALELANSLQADRLEREKLRLEKERLAQQDRRAQQEAQRFNETYRSQDYNNGYFYPYRPYPRPPHHGKPHPRPPQEHGSSVPKRVYLGR